MQMGTVRRMAAWSRVAVAGGDGRWLAWLAVFGIDACYRLNTRSAAVCDNDSQNISLLTCKNSGPRGSGSGGLVL